MISDSIPWKDDLVRVANTLEKRRTQKRWTERTSYLVERDVMVAAFSVRKLHEARKISDELVATPVTVRQFKVKDKPPDMWTRYEHWNHYDLANGLNCRLSLLNFCNQIIHSWNWMLSATEQRPYRFDGIYISSDHKRTKVVYFVPVEAMIHVFRSVGVEDILSWEMRTNEDGERRVTRVIARPESRPVSLSE